MPVDYKNAAKQIVSPDGIDATSYGAPSSFTDQLMGAVRGDSNKVQPGDESIYPNSPRNLVVNGLGLPDSWMQSAADQKQYFQNLPAQMGAGTLGTLGRVGPSAAEALGAAVPSEFGRTVAFETRQAPEAVNEIKGIVDRAFQKSSANDVNEALTSMDPDKLKSIFGSGRNAQKILDFYKNK